MTSFDLTPEQFRALWVKELRSGNWRQAKDALATLDGRFCCLGVACELYIREGGYLHKEKNWNGNISYEGTSFYLPDVVSSALGLQTDDGRLNKTYRTHQSLAQCNDSGCKFTTIANIIERGDVVLLETTNAQD